MVRRLGSGMGRKGAEGRKSLSLLSSLPMASKGLEVGDRWGLPPLGAGPVCIQWLGLADFGVALPSGKNFMVKGG